MSHHKDMKNQDLHDQNRNIKSCKDQNTQANDNEIKL